MSKNKNKPQPVILSKGSLLKRGSFGSGSMVSSNISLVAKGLFSKKPGYLTLIIYVTFLSKATKSSLSFNGLSTHFKNLYFWKHTDRPEKLTTEVKN